MDLWTGGLKDRLLKLTKEYGVEEKVYFPGYVENIHEVMVNSAVFALTSDYEGVSNSMIEALAIGIPTVCTDCRLGGARRFINNENGILIPVNDDRALCNALCEIVEKLQLAEKMSNNSVKIRKRLDLDRITLKWKLVISL